MTTQALINLLETHNITDQLTEILIERFNDSAPYLPILGTSEFAALFDESLIREAQNILRDPSRGESLMLSILFAMYPAENNPLLMLNKVRASSCDDQLFNPEDTTACKTLLTVDFLRYLMLSDALSPYALTQLKERLKANRFNFLVEVPEMPEPNEEEMREALLEGILEMMKTHPKKFQRAVSTALIKKNLNPQHSTADLQELVQGLTLTSRNG